MKLWITGFLILAAIFIGCTGNPGSQACTGKTVLDANGAITVCVDGKLTASCSGEGSAYSESATEKIVCSGGKWVKEAVSKPPEANATGASDATGAPGNMTGPADAGEEENCTGRQWLYLNGVTTACVDGKMTSSCDTEGEVYKESLAMKKKVVCESGRWALFPIVSANESGDGGIEDGKCSGKSTFTVNGVTKVCIDGDLTETCDTEGEVYSQIEVMNLKTVCENGKWVSKDIE